MSTCPRCGAVFECGMKDAVHADEPCWCMSLPALPPESYIARAAANGCFCPGCMRALVRPPQEA